MIQWRQDEIVEEMKKRCHCSPCYIKFKSTVFCLTNRWNHNVWAHWAAAQLSSKACHPQAFHINGYMLHIPFTVLLVFPNVHLVQATWCLCFLMWDKQCVCDCVVCKILSRTLSMVVGCWTLVVFASMSCCLISSCRYFNFCICYRINISNTCVYRGPSLY